MYRVQIHLGSLATDDLNNLLARTADLLEAKRIPVYEGKFDGVLWFAESKRLKAGLLIDGSDSYLYVVPEFYAVRIPGGFWRDVPYDIQGEVHRTFATLAAEWGNDVVLYPAPGCEACAG